MNITWGTYLSHLGHEDSPGCFRCHNDEHETEDGLVISQDCETCHTLLAMEEEDPEILQMLRP
jgi:nitrate/TMAO reductase-like tetraheme cytochrome c subunit